ncbi:MAG: sigma-54-dependent Fis family transcriptional regulator [Desulfofustis sp.]|nr:sigma-54-dependent Fis family transcriptional regulator [Desulfofustis sp.]
MGKILIIDDDPEICETLESLARRLDHRGSSVQTIQGGRQIVIRECFDVVFLDVRLPDGNGLDLLPELFELSDPPEIIILTGKGDPDGAELAIKGGVWDYVLKPSSIRELTLTLNRAMRYRREKRDKEQHDEVVSDDIIGVSPEMKAARRLLGQAAGSEANLLLSGETGTGKEIFARTVHANSSRASGRFVVVDCASLTESLVESILFGHRKGAFTGAHDHQVGLIKLADQGTLFLDEIGEMPLSIQKIFLRVLQERTFRAVGDAREQRSLFRLLAATNRDLDEMVENGEFRGDLLFRIKTMMIHLPPLRLRRGDIRILAMHKIQQYCQQYGLETKSVSDDFFEMLEHYHWPGNVRELFNMVERAVVAAGAEHNLFAMHLPRSLRIQVAKEQIKKMTGSVALADDPGPDCRCSVRKIRQDLFRDIFDCPLPNFKEFRSTLEKVYLVELIRQEQGDVARILDVSELSRSHFYYLLKKHHLSIQAE